jgi:hypothetical protein
VGEGHRGECRYLLICRVAAAPYRHPRCFGVPHLLAELAQLGEVLEASQSPKTPAHWGYESPEYVVKGETPGFVAVGQAPEVVAVGHAHASPGLAPSPGLAQVAQ